LLTKFNEIIDQLKNNAKECEARLESKVDAGLNGVVGRAQNIWQAKFERATDMWQTKYESRLSALEEGKHDHVKMFTESEYRLSALEGRVGALPGLRQLQQHNHDLEQEISGMKTNMQKDMHHFEDQVGQLKEILHQHKIAHHEDFTNLKAVFDNKMNVLKKDISASCWLIRQSIGQHEPKKEQTIANGLGKLEESIDRAASVLTKENERLSDGARQVPASKTANGSKAALNVGGTSSTSIVSSVQLCGSPDASLKSTVGERMHANHGASHISDRSGLKVLARCDCPGMTSLSSLTN